MNIPKELEGVLVTTPDTLSGSVRFKGTRVPLQALLDTLAEGLGIEDFLEGWPDVTREQALAVVVWEQDQVRSRFDLELVG
jgi:uncharacterized protein (DUF433 family)